MCPKQLFSLMPSVINGDIIKSKKIKQDCCNNNSNVKGAERMCLMYDKAKTTRTDRVTQKCIRNKEIETKQTQSERRRERPSYKM